VAKDLFSASYGTGQPSGCQYSPDVRTDRGTTYTNRASALPAWQRTVALRARLRLDPEGSAMAERDPAAAAWQQRLAERLSNNRTRATPCKSVT
jgi:hypothetical protein